VRDIVWLQPNGQEMADAEWDADWVRSIGVRLDGSALDELGEDGDLVRDDDLLLLLNAHDGDVDFTLPETLHGGDWELCIDTRYANGAEPATFADHALYRLGGRSLALFRSFRKH
jgi:isoamylase